MTEDKSLATSRAAGYCGATRATSPGRCTRPPHHGGPHVDHYNGRRAVTDTEGYRWPQR